MKLPAWPQRHPIRKARVTFQGQEYLLIGTKKYGGAIATQHQYDNILDPFAHLRRYGTQKIVRYGKT